ncbi:MAG: PKD domain-containing protein [Bernardetiaceae bacterium]
MKNNYLVFGCGLLAMLWASVTLAKDPVLTQGGPWLFLENKQQWDAQVRYRAELPGGFLFVHQNQLQYSFYDREAVGHQHGQLPPDTKIMQPPQAQSPKGLIHAHSFLVSFPGSNEAPIIEAQQPSETYYNFFLGDDPSRWATHVRGFTELTFKDLYPEIDLVLQLQAQKKRYKYEFHLAAGANPDQIQMHYQHADTLWLDQEGNLHVQTSVNTVIEQKPYSYQIIDGKEVVVPSRFHLQGQTLTFTLGDYDSRYPLIIDPVLIFSTFSGSFSDNWGSTAAADAAGNLYSGGTAFGPNFPVTPGAFDVAFDGVTDMAILKYNARGSALIYATFIGGAFHDIPYSMIVDGQNNLIIFGMTDSGNFPMPGNAYDRSYNGGIENTPGIYGIDFRNGSDMVLVKLNAGGNQLLGATFLGGSSNDGLMIARNTLVVNYGDEHRGEVVVDAQNNIYIASVTFSQDFPFSRPVRLAASVGVLAKFTPNLSQLLWAVPVGGSFSDALYSLKIGPNGDVYACGGTVSPNINTHPEAYETNYSGGHDGFVVRYSTNGAFIGATYLGTRLNDQAYLLDLDQESNVYVFGQTFGNYPVSRGVYSNPNSGQFIHSLSPDLSRSRFSTVVGSGQGSPNISPTGFMVNSCGNIFLTGWGGAIVPTGVGYFAGSNVAGMPITSDALRASTDGSDFYLMVIERDLNRLLFGSYFGSTQTLRASDHVDGGTSRFDKETATIYHAACACNGNDFPTTSDAFSTVNNSPNCSNAAFKLAFDAFSADFLIRDQSNNITQGGCAPFRVRMDNQSTGDNNRYFWVFGDSLFTSTEKEPTYVFEQPGIYTVTLRVENVLLCQEQTIQRRITVFGSDVRVSNDTTICQGQSVVLEVSGGNSYQWSPAESLNNPTLSQPTATPNQTTTYTVRAIGEGGCIYDREVTVTVLPEVRPDFELNITGGCGTPRQVSVRNTTEGATTFSWDFGNGVTSQERDPAPVTYSQEGIYTITLIASAGSCSGTIRKEIEIVIRNVGFFDEVEVSPDPTICQGESARIFVRSQGDIYRWSPSLTLSNPDVPDPIATPQETTTYNVVVRVRDEPDCVLDTSVTVFVIPEVIPDFSVDLEGVCFELPIVRIRNRTQPDVSYTWDLGDGRTLEGDSLPPFRYTIPGTYTIRLIANNGPCSDTTAQTVDIEISEPDFLRTVKMPKDPTICAGESTVLAIEGQANTFRWSPAEGLSDPTSAAPLASPERTTTYTVRIGRDDAPGCDTDSLVTVFVEQPFDPRFSAQTPTQCGEPPAVTLTNLTEGQPDRFLWIIDGDTIRTRQPDTYTFDRGGEYNITLIAESGTGACLNVFSQVVAVDDVNPANVLTPNGDGKNDRFIIDTSRSGWQLHVFDRWGGEVFRSDDYQNDWGDDLKSGAYFYRLVSPEGFACKGWVHVLVE